MNLPFKSRLVTLALLAFTQHLLAAPPANNAFANRIPITGTLPQAITGTNVDATTESGEPSHAGYPATASVWWTWTAPSSGECQFQVSNSNFNSVMGIYTGTVVNSLTPVGSASFTDLASVQVVAGTTYQIAVAGYPYFSPSSGIFTLNVGTIVPPPANDAFANRSTLSGAPTSVIANNIAATVESGEPLHAGSSPSRSVWWTWTAPTSGECQFQITNSNFSSRMGIYTGAAVNSLTQVGSASSTTPVYVQVVAGTSYQIAVGGTSSSFGSFTLNVSTINPPPTNDAFANRSTLSGAPTSVIASNIGATAESGEPSHAGSTANGSVWWTWTAPASGECPFQITNSTLNSRMGIYTGTAVGSLTQVGSAFSTDIAYLQVVAGTTYQIAVGGVSSSRGTFTLNVGTIVPPPANDAFANRSSLSGAPTSVAASNNGATVQSGEPSHAGSSPNRSVWWTWTAPTSGECQFQVTNSNFTSRMGIYTGTAVNSLTQVGSASSTTPVYVQVVAGTSYQIAVGGTSSSFGNFTLNVGTIYPPPSNDAFANRSTLSGTPTSVAASNNGATAESGEPSHAGNPANGSVWWTWTAPSSGECQFQVTNSNFTSTLGIYTGTAVNSLTQVGSAFSTNSAYLQVVAGTSYQIAVGGDPYASSRRGSFTLNVGTIFASPSNDAFANRSTLSGAPTSVTASNIGATAESGEPSHAGYPANGSVWWTWTAPTSGECLFQVTNSNFTSLMGIYTGTAVNGLTQVASAYATNTAFVQVAAGTTYQIAVSGYPYSSSRGNFTLNVGTIYPPPSNDAFANRLTLPPGLTLIAGTGQGATREAGEPYHAGYYGIRSVWYSWTAPATGEISIAITQNTFSPILGVYTGTSVNALTAVASTGFNTLSFRVQAATTYHIVVDSNSPGGPFTLNMGNVILPPANDSFASSIMLPGGQTATTGSNLAATKEAGEPNHAFNIGGKSVWWSWTAPSAGEVSIEITGASFPTLIGVYTGGSVNALTPAGATVPGTFASFLAAAGTTYHIAVDASVFPTPGSYTLSISNPVAPPPNDNFANRVALTTSTYISEHNQGASKESGEPAHAGNTGGKSVWYRWTAPTSGSYRAYLLGIGQLANHGLLAVYTGGAVNALTSVGGAISGSPRMVSFTASAGTEYQVAVDGASYTAGVVYSGTFTLGIWPAAGNDAFASATDLGTAASGTSAKWIDYGTTTETGEPGHPIMPGFPSPYRSIWWKWMAPSSGWFSFDTLTADFDTVLEVYTGAAVNALTLVASNHDADPNGRSSLALNAVSGTTYYIRVRGETLNELGNVTLQYGQLGAPVTAADHVRLGRAHLQLQNTAALGTADAQIDGALALDANHPEANLLKAITRLARLEQGSAFQASLTGLGLVDGDLYEGGHTLPTDINGDPVAIPGTHSSHGLSYLVNTILPELPLIRAHLDKAAVSGFQSSLSDTESTSRYTRFDEGDISLLKASTYLTEAMIRFLQTYDSGASMADLITQNNTAALTAKGIADSFSNLLGNTGNNQRTAFKTALQNANTHYQAASTFIRTSRPDAADEKHLFFLPADATATEAAARTHAQEASAALDGPAVLAGESVDLSVAISSPQSLREQLPGLIGNKAVASTSPDPTFGGAAPGMTQAKLNDRLRKLGILHEVSSFGNWTQHYLGSLPPGSQDKNDDPDGDMLSNFAEFAFNLDPARGSASSEFAVGGLETNVVDNKPYLNIAFRRRIVRDTVNYIVAVSDNLTTWDRTQAQVVQVGAAVPNADGITETVKFRVVADPDITTRKFVRVEAVDLAP